MSVYKVNIEALVNKIKSPGFIIDKTTIRNYFYSLYSPFKKQKIFQYFPLKSHNIYMTLDLMKDSIDGFAASSLFEAKLAYEILGHNKHIHFTSPGLRVDEIDELLELCDGISFNSLAQWVRFKNKAIGHIDCGLRINPQLSYIKDKRYDPCRKHSRLGVPLNQVQGYLKTDPALFEGINGLHFHTNCDSKDLVPLFKTVELLDKKIPELLKQCQWINLGGGYLLDNNTDLSPLIDAARLLQNKYDLQVIIEPGSAVVSDACYLVSSVIDIIPSDGKQIAVLDTTVNHMPEVFEYQFSPDILQENENGQYSYILEGSTCLAGDHFGEYAFDKPLEVGSKIVFTGMGAYTMVKANMFNGINLPAVYILTEKGDLKLQKEFTYEDFKRNCGVTKNNESLRKKVKPESYTKKRRVA